MLEDMVRSAFDLTVPGGRFIGVGLNMLMKVEDFPYIKKYGYILSLPGDKKELEDGDMFNVNLKDEKNNVDFQIQDYYYTLETFEKTFSKVGFENFKLHPF